MEGPPKNQPEEDAKYVVHGKEETRESLLRLYSQRLERANTEEAKDELRSKIEALRAESPLLEELKKRRERVDEALKEISAKESALEISDEKPEAREKLAKLYASQKEKAQKELAAIEQALLTIDVGRP